MWPHLVRVFPLVARVLTGDDGGVSEREPGPAVTLVWALDEVFIGFAGRPVAVVRRELEEACETWDCRLDEDTLDVFAAEIAAGERVENLEVVVTMVVQCQVMGVVRRLERPGPQRTRPDALERVRPIGGKLRSPVADAVHAENISTHPCWIPPATVGGTAGSR